MYFSLEVSGKDLLLTRIGYYSDDIVIYTFPLCNLLDTLILIKK